MKNTLVLAVLLLSQLTLAALPDGLYQGTGTWEKKDSSGAVVASGVLESSWEETGLVGKNVGVLKSGSMVVATFQDTYKFDLITSLPEAYNLTRLINGQYVAVGSYQLLGLNYQADFNQDGMQAIESGNVVGNTLVRIGHLNATDGSVIYYRVSLTK